MSGAILANSCQDTETNHCINVFPTAEKFSLHRKHTEINDREREGPFFLESAPFSVHVPTPLCFAVTFELKGG